jgi:hypothetical protein
MRTTLTGVFRDPEAALRASERLRELTGAWGVATGLVFVYVALSIARSWPYAVLALACGALFGVLLGGWLGGQRYRRSLRPHMRARYLALVRQGRAVVLVDVLGSGEDVRLLMEESGAYVSEGHWPVRDTLQPV